MQLCSGPNTSATRGFVFGRPPHTTNPLAGRDGETLQLPRWHL